MLAEQHRAGEDAVAVLHVVQLERDEAAGVDARSFTRAVAPRAYWTRAGRAIRKRLAEYCSPVAKRDSQVED